MEKWRQAVELFLKDWKENEEVIGALVCGSYVTGNPSEHSDIDLHILLKSGIDWRERGNKVVDGYLIEYFANPKEQILKYFHEEIASRSCVTAHMFSSGEILFDKTGELGEVVKQSADWMKKPFDEMSDISSEIKKYFLWDMQDNLHEVYKHSRETFSFVYHCYLKEIYATYSEYTGFPAASANKVIRFLENENDKKKYMIPDFPDKVFQNLFVKAAVSSDTNEMVILYENITNHVLNMMGGFKIDGWKIRTPLDI